MDNDNEPALSDREVALVRKHYDQYLAMTDHLREINKDRYYAECKRIAALSATIWQTAFNNARIRKTHKRVDQVAEAMRKAHTQKHN